MFVSTHQRHSSQYKEAQRPKRLCLENDGVARPLPGDEDRPSYRYCATDNRPLDVPVRRLLVVALSHYPGAEQLRLSGDLHAGCPLDALEQGIGGAA